MIEFKTSGESHGEYIVGILSGIPSKLKINREFIKEKLRLRREGYGRSERMKIEEDEFEFFGGLDEIDLTTGAPIGFRVFSLDYKINKTKRYTQIPRPGHVDYAGSVKFDFENFYLPSERRSGRLTVLDLIAGSICELLLNELGIKIYFLVSSIGGIKIQTKEIIENIEEFFPKILSSHLFVPYLEIEERIKKLIDEAKKDGDTLGGSGIIVVKNFPVGVGDYNDYKDNLDGLIAQSVISIPSVKGFEIGDGILSSKKRGSEVHDEFYIYGGKLKRKKNSAGGIEGGVSNGEDIVIKFYAKPIPTMLKKLSSVDFSNWVERESCYVRSDIVVVPAITLIAAARVSIVLASELKKKFGGDTIYDLKSNLENYLEVRRRFWQK
ncbi:MAG: chorismate synthase [Caldisericia bacterium]